MRRRLRWLAAGTLGLLAAPACGDVFGIEDVLGIWNTQSINGYPVPGIVEYRAVNYDVEYGRWAFYDGQRCTLTQEVGGTVETYDACEYTVDGEAREISITFRDEAWDGTVEGSTMTLIDPQDIVWILRRQ